MTTLDLDFVRSQFPAFAEATLDGWAYFENAGGSYACRQVIEQLNSYYTQTKIQPYGFSPASKQAGEQMDSARSRMAKMLNVASDEVHFGPSTTQNIYVMAAAVRGQLKVGDEVIVTNLDHESNIGAWRHLEDAGAVIREWRINPDSGELDLADLDELLSEKTRVVAFTHASNVVATFNPVRQICDRVHAAGAIAVVDGVSFCGHGLPDVDALGCDVYLFSLYKVYGPHQGVMVVRRETNQALPNQGHFFNDTNPTARFTPAGPDHAQIAAINGVMDYFEAVYRHHVGEEPEACSLSAAILNLFQAHEHRLLQPLLDYLDARCDVRLIGRTAAVERAPTVAFASQNIPAATLANCLSEHQIMATAGHFYAWRCIKALGIDPEEGVLRLSFVHYTTEDEVQRLIRALDQVL
jgi:cysteine desulfurase family protein (TIGR01976 family)